MINSINTIDNVKNFIQDVIKEGVNFHPDTDFNDYINITTDVPLYTAQEAALRNKLLKQCFIVCSNKGAEIYEIAYNVFGEVTGLNKTIKFI